MELDSVNMIVCLMKKHAQSVGSWLGHGRLKWIVTSRDSHYHLCQSPLYLAGLCPESGICFLSGVLLAEKTPGDAQSVLSHSTL